MEWNKGDYAILDNYELVKVTKVDEDQLELADMNFYFIFATTYRIRKLTKFEERLVSYFVNRGFVDA